MSASKAPQQHDKENRVAFDIKLKHERAANYDTRLATGMLIQMLSDGMVHLTFYRDASVIEAENFTSDSDPTTGVQTVAVRHSEKVVDSTSHREDVVTVAIPSANIKVFSDAFNKIPGLIESAAADAPQ